MRNVLLLFAALAFLASCQNEAGISTDIINHPLDADGNIDYSKLPKMAFENQVYDFDTIAQGEKVKHFFKFTNTGNSDLIVTSAKGSCGCTVPSWPKEPIAPGQTGEIKVIFDSDGKSGKQHKKVHIVSNTYPATASVALSGHVATPGK